MTLPFIEREPTQDEFEKFRLILSTYQDGSGQLVVGDRTLPGWRDFERSVAAAFNGIAQENKYIFDVLIPDPVQPGKNYGLSCKMRRALDETLKTSQVTLELSNSSGKFWGAIEMVGLNQQNYKNNPATVGGVLLDLVRSWHLEVSLQSGGSVDLGRSYYLALSWNKRSYYQLFQFPIELPLAETISWDFPLVKTRGHGTQLGRHLRGCIGNEIIFEWYGESGGQLKYYPLIRNAQWKSSLFQLEPLLDENIANFGLLAKAKTYFPGKWHE